MSRKHKKPDINKAGDVAIPQRDLTTYADNNWIHRCEVCGTLPTVGDLGLCLVCLTGETEGNIEP